MSYNVNLYEENSRSDAGQKNPQDSSERTDKPRMTFEIAAAYGVAGAVTILLRWMAARNRRSGWQRERNDVFLEDLMTWAEAGAALRGRPQPQAQPAVHSEIQPFDLTTQLLALQGALNTNAGARCEPKATEGTPTLQHEASRASK